jgi:hypothetical protein
MTTKYTIRYHVPGHGWAEETVATLTEARRIREIVEIDLSVDESKITKAVR